MGLSNSIVHYHIYGNHEYDDTIYHNLLTNNDLKNIFIQLPHKNIKPTNAPINMILNHHVFHQGGSIISLTEVPISFQ